MSDFTEFTEDDYILGIWFTYSKGLCNHMSLIKRGDKKNSWEGFCRIRFYNQEGRNDPFSDNDRKTFFEIRTDNMTEKQMIKKMNEVFDSFEKCPTIINPFIQDHVIVCGTLTDLIEKCKDKPWFHMKKEEKQ